MDPEMLCLRGPYLVSLSISLAAGGCEYIAPLEGLPASSSGFDASADAVGPLPNHGCSTNKPFPSTPVLETFGDSLQHWVDPKGVFSIEGGVLRASGAGGIYWSQPFGANQEVYAHLVDWDPNVYRLSVVLKKQNPMVDCDNILPYYSHFFGSGTDTIQVEYCWHSSNLGGQDLYVPIDLHKGQELGARAFADGHVDLYVDRQCVLGLQFPTEGAGGPPWMSQGGYIGVEAVPVKDGTVFVHPAWDDFGGGDFVPGP
jgi:hypothetical protein